MLWFTNPVNDLLKRFEKEACLTVTDTTSLPLPFVDKRFRLQLCVIRHDKIRIAYRDLYAEGIATTLLTKSSGWEAHLLSLRGGVGIIACAISLASKQLGQEPKLVYLDRNATTGVADITAEWYKQDIDLEWRRKMHKVLGFEMAKVARFSDVLEEARKFLEEAYGGG
jgi:hypothetical protein